MGATRHAVFQSVDDATMRIYSQPLKRAKRDYGKAFDSLVADARETVLGSHGEPTDRIGEDSPLGPQLAHELAQTAKKKPRRSTPPWPNGPRPKIRRLTGGS
jgi:hypothetical protein